LSKPKYNVIYADPPWSYKNYNYATTKGGQRAKRGCEKEYSTMNIEDIKALPIQELAADDCLLFMWVTFPLLQEGIDTIEAWGFEYKTIAFNWVKKNKKSDSLFWGMGNWTRSNSEICLLGIKGKPKRECAGVHSVIIAPIEQHSKKPEIIRDRIVKLCGDVPRVELFARQKADGWDSWGNEVDSDLEIKIEKEIYNCPNCDVEMKEREMADGKMMACGICSYGWYL
jgi:N6-adenosine-specific RNA methylase IME4